MTISRTKKLAGVAAAASIALALAGCGSAPEETDPTGDAGDVVEGFTPCLVSDDGGFNDKSFNQSALEGMERAADELGVDMIEVESASANDYAPNLENLIAEGCSFIVSVGFKLSADTIASATANPEVSYAIIDDNSIDLPNVKPIVFDTAQAAFLAGYAAASYTETGIIATWGGIQIPPVTIFMDGFYHGAMYYNEQNGTDVQVLGWDPEAQNGSFTGGFEAGVEAKAMAETFIGQNADVLLPVGGPIFLSAAEAIRDQGDDAGIALIGVDADLYETSPENADLFLTSILKEMATGVETVVTEAAAGEFSNEPYVGTLENGGVALAPFHDFEGEVDPELQTQLDEIEAGIIAGDIVVESPSSP